MKAQPLWNEAYLLDILKHNDDSSDCWIVRLQEAMCHAACRSRETTNPTPKTLKLTQCRLVKFLHAPNIKPDKLPSMPIF